MKRLNIGVIGAGGIADRRAIPGILRSDRLRLAALMDQNGELAGRLGEKYGVPAYSQLDRLLADPAVEAVYIASPVFCHKEQVQAAAAAGKHILCEKPFALTSEDAEAMVLDCRERGVCLSAGFMMRFHPLHQEIRRLIAENALGDLVHIYANFSCWYPDNGSWRQTRALSGGGSLMDMGVHSLDLIQYLTGRPVRLLAADIRTQQFRYEVEDSASLLGVLPGGCALSVASFFCIPDQAAPSRLEIYGTQGSVCALGTLGQTLDGTLTGTLAGGAPLERTAAEGKNLYQAEFEQFYDRILSGAGDSADGGEMVAIQKLVEEAYRLGRQ